MLLVEDAGVAAIETPFEQELLHSLLTQELDCTQHRQVLTCRGSLHAARVVIGWTLNMMVGCSQQGSHSTPIQVLIGLVNIARSKTLPLSFDSVQWVRSFLLQSLQAADMLTCG